MSSQNKNSPITANFLDIANIDKKGLDESVILEISRYKQEPDWVTQFRLDAFKQYKALPMPEFGPDLSDLDLNDIQYFMRSTDKVHTRWQDVPKEIKDTFEALGIPKAEQEYLSGVKAQYESEVIYSSLKKELANEGVIFLDIDTAIKKHPEFFTEYFGKLVPPTDNKFAALNSAAFSGGSFVYIPKNTVVTRPLQAYFRLNAQRMGQFERTLIIVDEGSEAHYVEGCTAPMYTTNSLHAAVVEIYIKSGAKLRYTTVQNWSKNVYNLVTKRAHIDAHGSMAWVDGNLGSKVSMKYPACILAGTGAHGEMLSIGYASSGQCQDVGAKMIHLAPKTTSIVHSKSISVEGGISNYRGLTHVSENATDVRSRVECDALILDSNSVSNSYPLSRIKNSSATVEHEAVVTKLDDMRLLYLMNRGISQQEARRMIIAGFVDPIVKELPIEYALELNRFFELAV